MNIQRILMSLLVTLEIGVVFYFAMFATQLSNLIFKQSNIDKFIEPPVKVILVSPNTLPVIPKVSAPVKSK